MEKYWAPVLVILLACGTDAQPRDVADGAVVDSDGGSQVTDYFVSDHVLEIDITLDSADWDRIRLQKRDIFGTFLGADCLDAPLPNPFSYAEATVSVDGEVRGRVGVRKKGFFGSLHDHKPSLKLKFSEFIDTQDLNGTVRMTLNNANQDPAYLNQCVGYRLFENAGIPAPRCNFAHVTVNGVDLGLYVHVENVKKRFLRRHFADDEGNLYEGNISDFRTGWMGTFEQKTNKIMPSDRSDLMAVRNALEAAPAGLSDRLAPLIDLNDFYRFWAMEVLVGHWDGYAGNSNNFFAYNDPTDQRLHFIPWGIDAILSGQSAREPKTSAPALASSALTYQLYGDATARGLYEAELRNLLDTAWDETAIQADIDEIVALLEPYLSSRDMDRGFDAAVQRARDFVQSRRATLLAGLESTYTPPPLRDSFCFVPMGDISGTFETTFGSLGNGEPFGPTRKGTLTGTINGSALEFALVGASSGKQDGRAALAIIGAPAEGQVLIVGFQLGISKLKPGANLQVDLITTAGLLLEVDAGAPEGTDPKVIGMLNGTLTLEAAGSEDDAPIRGRFDAMVYESIF